MMRFTMLSGAGIAMIGCTDFAKETGPTFYSQEVLDEYLKAIPTQEDISVLLPESFQPRRGFGDPAFFPEQR